MARKTRSREALVRDQIISIIKDNGKPIHPREVATRLGLEPEEVNSFLDGVEALVEGDYLTVLPGGRLRLGPRTHESTGGAGADPNRFDGSLTVNPRGFGFVASVGHDDVFIPPDALYEGMHGDLVSVEVLRRTAKGSEGRITAIVKRRDPRVAGVIRVRRKGAWLEPDDTRIRGPIVLRGEIEGAKDGDAAVVEITRFPKFAEELPEGELKVVLGPAGDPQTEVKKILLNAQVEEVHPPEALQNAEEMAAKLRHVQLGERRDLRSIPLPTIDPEDARDHDDALWVERHGSSFRAYIAIADVSEYVRLGSALDEAARVRGCTIYLPDRAIPMLPRALAGDLCSLLPEVDRYCLCVIADLDANAAVSHFEIVEGVMRSQARLTYGGVARALGFDPESPQSPQAEAMLPGLQILADLATRLRSRRMNRGALDLDLPEPRVHLDTASGLPVNVTKRATRPGLKKAYSLVEELMLLANDLVAEWLTKKQAPTIYRVHGAPDEQKLERLEVVGEKWGLKIDLEMLAEPKGLSRFLQSLSAHPRAEVLSMLLLRSLKQAQYDTANIGHFGLASPCYLHFTSPIRRYPDLAVHRQVKRILRGEAIDRSTAALETLKMAATESSTRERAAMEVEREVVDLYRALYMRQHLGETFAGKVTAVTGSGLFVALNEPFCDVLVLYEGLGPDRYEISDDEISAVGVRSGDTVTLGDAVQVTITDVAIGRRTVYGTRVVSDAMLAEAAQARASGDAPHRGARPGGGRGPGERAGRPGRAAAPAGRATTRSGGAAPARTGGRPAAEGKSATKGSARPAGSSPRTSAKKARAQKSTSEKLLAAGRTSTKRPSEKVATRRGPTARSGGKRKGR